MVVTCCSAAPRCLPQLLPSDGRTPPVPHRNTGTLAPPRLRARVHESPLFPRLVTSGPARLSFHTPGADTWALPQSPYPTQANPTQPNRPALLFVYRSLRTSVVSVPNCCRMSFWLVCMDSTKCRKMVCVSSAGLPARVGSGAV